MSGAAAEQGDEADEAFGGMAAKMDMPPHARAGWIGRGHRFAAYPRCWADPEEEMMEPSEVARAFVSKINAHDLDGLCSLMTHEHAFVDALGNRAVGRSTMQGGWRAYFSMVPDYWIEVDTVLQDGNMVALFGRAGGSYSASATDSAKQQWHVPAAWLAEVAGDRVAVWRVYADNLPLRQLMGQESQSVDRDGSR